MNILEHLNPNAVKLKTSGIRRIMDLAKSKEGCIGLTIGEPDFHTPEIIKEKVKEALDANMTHYPENIGYNFLREAISKYEKEQNGLSYSPDEIIVTCGATEALHTSLYTIIASGDEVIIPTPDFMLYDSLVEMCGGACVQLNTANDGFQITKDSLEAVYTAKTKAIILNSPNNPSGCIYSKESLQVIHDFFLDKPVFIICDDVYRQLIFTKEYVSFSSYEDMRERIIVVQSFSKPYAMTGWRVGYIMADMTLIKALRPVHQYTLSSIPSFVQTACVEALNYDIKEMVDSYKSRRDYVYDRLVEMGLEIIKPEGAFYAFPSIEKYGMDSEEFCLDMIERVGLALTPGVFFGCEGFVRISYCYSDEILVEAMNRLETYLKTLSKA